MCNVLNGLLRGVDFDRALLYFHLRPVHARELVLLCFFSPARVL